jgi:hypothetical protein
MNPTHPMTDTNTPGERQTPLTDHEVVLVSVEAASMLGENWTEAVSADFARKLELRVQELEKVAESLLPASLAMEHDDYVRKFGYSQAHAGAAARSALGGEAQSK